MYELGDWGSLQGDEGDDEAWFNGAFPGVPGVAHVLLVLVLVAFAATCKDICQYVIIARPIDLAGPVVQEGTQAIAETPL